MALLVATIPALPVGAKNVNYYESPLFGNLLPNYPDILNYGKVEINSELVVEMSTDAVNRTYNNLLA